MTTFIKSYDKLSIGDAPANLQVESVGWGSGLQATFHAFDSVVEKTHAQLRKKQNEYALFLFAYADTEIPEWWQDAEIIWTLE